MNYSISLDGGITTVALTGFAMIDAWEKVIERLTGEAAVSQGTRLMLVIHGVLGFMGIPERRYLGELLAEKFAHLSKVAVVVEAQKVTGVVEGAAQGRGLTLRVFSDDRAAHHWLSA